MGSADLFRGGHQRPPGNNTDGVALSALFGALGCVIGQGLTGVSTLALGSILTLFTIIGGSVAAVKYQAWRVERM